jgi:hypothetical protein
VGLFQFFSADLREQAGFRTVGPRGWTNQSLENVATERAFLRLACEYAHSRHVHFTAGEFSSAAFASSACITPSSLA